MKMEEQVGMIGHNKAYFNNDEEDDLYEDSLHKNETIEHTREPTQKAQRDSLYGAQSVEAMRLNVNSNSSSIEPKKWIPGNEMSRRDSEIKIETNT